jgi:Flp pilus assembly protein TadB
MDSAASLPSSDQDREELEPRAGEDAQASAFRRFFVTRLAVIIGIAWLLSWPIHLLPHTVVWTLLATAALIIGLTSTPGRKHSTSPDMSLKRPR